MNHAEAAALVAAWEAMVDANTEYTRLSKKASAALTLTSKPVVVTVPRGTYIIRRETFNFVPGFSTLIVERAQTEKES